MLTVNLEENRKRIDKILGVGHTFDISYRHLKILDNSLLIYYLDGLVSNDQVIEIIKVLYRIPHEREFSKDLIRDSLSHLEVTPLQKISEVTNYILNGLIVILIESSKTSYAIDVRKFPARSISEPDTEKVIRGAHDGFTENISFNVALLRRRVKDGNLRNEMFQIGEASPTYVVLSYIKTKADKTLIDEVRNRILKVKTQHLIMSDKQLEELIINQKINPYPLVRYTERPDSVAVHLYQGMFAIFVDTSPSVILAPITFFDHLGHLEEYRQTPLSGTYLRFLRYIGVFLSLFLTPLWYLSVKNGWLTGIFAVLNPSEEIAISIFMQIIAAEVSVEFLRMASIHTPSALQSAMGIIAGVLIGDMAIKVGILSPEVILLVAISATCTYITPSYELGLANKISKLLFIVSIYFFGTIGFIVTVILWFAYLITLKSFTKPYMYPLIPFNLKDLLKVIFRNRYKNDKKGGN